MRYEAFVMLSKEHAWLDSRSQNLTVNPASKLFKAITCQKSETQDARM